MEIVMLSQSIVYQVPLRVTGTAYLWWFFLGGLGAHKFYLGKPLMGILYPLTLGFLGLGHLYDLFTMSEQVRRANDKIMSGMAFSPSGQSSPKYSDSEPLAESSIDQMISRYQADQERNDAGRLDSQRAGPPKPSGGFGKRR